MSSSADAEEPESAPVVVSTDDDDDDEELVKKDKKSKKKKSKKDKSAAVSDDEGGLDVSGEMDGGGNGDENKPTRKKKKKSKKVKDGAESSDDDIDLLAADSNHSESKKKSKKSRKSREGDKKDGEKKSKSKKLSVSSGDGGDAKNPKKERTPKKLKKQKSIKKTTRTTSLVGEVQPRYMRLAQKAAMTKKMKERAASQVVNNAPPADPDGTTPDGNTTSNSNNTKKSLGAPETLLDKAMRSIDVDPCLHDGITVLKITTGGKWEPRILTIAPNNQVMLVTHKKLQLSAKDNIMRVASKLPIPLWTPSKGLRLGTNPPHYVRYIDVADLDGWNIGVVGTQTLESARNKAMTKIKRDLDSNVGSIISLYHSGQESLNMLVEDETHLKALLKALHKLYMTYRQVDSWIGNDALLLRYIWYDIDNDKNEMICKKEFGQICARINFYVRDAAKRFDDFVENDIDHGNNEKGIRKEVTYKECTNLLESMKPEQPGTVIWNELFGPDKELITAEDLLETFLKTTQKEKDATLKDAQTLMLCINTIELEDDIAAAYDESTLTKKQFTSFLNSDFNDAFDPELQEIPGPLTEPLSHYWINTSHNTYLTGDQLQSKSSVEAYIRAMLRGCKCLELDCWDGPSLQDVFYIPVVFHGHTLTSKIEFRHIILVVNNFLEASPNSYPIILSLENHCSHPYQKAMAVCMTDIFGDKLFVPTPEQLAGDQPLPSPEELKGKVVIKGKRPPEKDDDVDGEEDAATKKTDSEDGGEDEDEEDDDPFNDSYEVNSEEGIDTGSPQKSIHKPPKVDPELARLTLFHGTKFKTFEKSIEQDYSHMHSIGETKITKVLNKAKDQADLWRKYNVDHMTRTYPAGARVDSSNYNPTLAWAMGCQLVALNFQTHDVPLLLNDGRFRQNGGCGYVLKPKGVMNASERTSMKIYKIQVLGGNCLPKPNAAKKGETIDPYVIVELHDVETSDDGNAKEKYYESTHKTEHIDDNGYCPVWNDEGKEFIVHNPEVAIFLFKMLDKDVVVDDKIAAAAIPVNCLRQGYRSIQLYDHHNSRTGAFRYATLLVKIDIV